MKSNKNKKIKPNIAYKEQKSSHFKKIIKDTITTRDNETADITRIQLWIAFIIFLAMTGMDVYFTHTFEYVQFAEGVGILFAGGGISLFLKKDTEPGAGD